MPNFDQKSARQGGDGFFITGTDTEIGKSFVTGSIGLTLAKQNIAATPRKPVASGCIRRADNSLYSEDALFLQTSFNTTDTLDEICPYCFEPAISPHLAMAQSHQLLNIATLAANCQPIPNRLILVEGAGGFYSPLAIDGLNADLAQTLNYPVILVVGDRLGCINHALLSLEAIAARGLKTQAIIINHLTPNQHYSCGLEELVSAPVFHSPYSIDGKAQILSNELIKTLLTN